MATQPTQIDDARRDLDADTISLPVEGTAAWRERRALAAATQVVDRRPWWRKAIDAVREARAMGRVW